MHMLSKKDVSSEQMDTVKRSRTSTVILTVNGEVHIREETQVFVHDLNLFVTVQLFEETSAVQSLGKLCEDHGYSFEWVSCQKSRLTKEGKVVICKTDNFVSLVVPGLSSNSESVSSSTSPSQVSLRRETEIASRKLVRPASSSSSDSVLVRSAKTKKKRRMIRNIRTMCWQIFLNDWRSSKKIWWTENYLHPHTVLRNQIWNILRKWQRNQGSTVLKLTSQKFEIATSAWEPKWQGILVEDVLTKNYLVQKSSETW